MWPKKCITHAITNEKLSMAGYATLMCSYIEWHPKIGTAVCGTARTVVWEVGKRKVGEKLLRFPPTRFAFWKCYLLFHLFHFLFVIPNSATSSSEGRCKVTVSLALTYPFWCFSIPFYAFLSLSILFDAFLCFSIPFDAFLSLSIPFNAFLLCIRFLKQVISHL